MMLQMTGILLWMFSQLVGVDIIFFYFLLFSLFSLVWHTYIDLLYYKVILSDFRDPIVLVQMSQCTKRLKAKG